MPQELGAIGLLRSLVRLYSPSGREREVASVIHRWLVAQSAFDNIEFDSVGNVVATKGPEPYLLLCGHMDTVPGRLPVLFDGGIIRGRGAVDAKGALAGICVGASAAARAGAKGLMLAAVVGEETEGKGMKSILAKGYQYVGGVFGEPSGGGIVVAYRGRMGLELEVEGKAAHASSAVLGVNAVEIGMETALRLKEELCSLGCAASITIVKGGKAENMIPAKCNIAMDVRIPITVNMEEVQRALQKYVRQGIKARVSDLTPPINVGRANRVFGSMSAAITEAGVHPRALVKVGTSDMNSFFLATKAPCVAYGPGDASLSHTDNEWVSEGEYLTSVRVYSSAIRRVLRT